MNDKGFSVVDLLVALTIAALLTTITLPALDDAVRSARLDGATRRLVSEAREIRTRAVSNGWEFRLVGYGSGSTDARANQFRVIGRSSSAVGWPDESSPVLASDTQVAEAWVDLGTDYAGVAIDSSGSNERFEITFDARGKADATTFAGLTLSKNDKTRTLAVSSAGSVRIQ